MPGRVCAPWDHACNGSMFVRLLFSQHFKDNFEIASSSVHEDGAVFGATNRVEEAVDVLLMRYPEVKVVPIISTCSTEVIGDDIDGVVTKLNNGLLKEKYAGREVHLIAIHTPSFVGSMVAGVQTEALNEASKTVARSAEIYIQQSVDVATILSRQEPVLKAFAGQPQEAQELLTSYVKSLPGYWSFLLFDLKGRIVAGVNSDMGDLTGGNRADRDYARQIFSGKDVALSESVMKAASGDVLIYVAAKAVRGKDGALLGAVAVCPRWTDFTEKTIDPIRLGRRGYGFTIDQSGRFISHSMDKKLLLQDYSKEKFIQDALAKGSGTFSYEWKGEDKFMRYAHFQRTRLRAWRI